MWCSTSSRTCSSLRPSSNRCARSGSSRDSRSRVPAAAPAPPASPASSTARDLQPRPRRRRRQDLLPRHPEPVREHRAQALVPLDQVAERRLQRRAVERARQPHRQRDHVGRRSVALQPLQEPQPPLRVGQRDLGRPRLRAPAARRDAAASDDSRAASAATLGASNRLRIATSTSKRRADPADQPRRQQRVAAELEEVVVDADPRARRSTSANSAHRIASCGVARRPVRLRRAQAPAPAAPGGRACRSASAAAAPAPRAPTAPCSPAAAATARPAAPRRRAPRPAPPPRSRPAAGRPRRPSRATTTACDTPACRSSAASISPGSIRKPRSFTWASARPRNSSTPSGRHRARSPVRYIRLPGRRRYGSATNRSAVSAGAVQIAARQTHARDVQLADNARRHRLKPAVQHIGPRVPDRPADRHLAPSRRRAGPARHVDRGLGRAVQVLQLNLRQIARAPGPAAPPAAPRRCRSPAAGRPQRVPSLAASRHMLDKGLQHRRHEVQRRHAMRGGSVSTS